MSVQMPRTDVKLIVLGVWLTRLSSFDDLGGSFLLSHIRCDLLLFPELSICNVNFIVT
jgi:hypothetical protein